MAENGSSGGNRAGLRAVAAARLVRSLLVAVAVLLCGWGAAPDAAAGQEEGANSGYRLGAGDRIRITVEDEPELSMEARVSLRGTIPYAYVGMVEVAGLTVPELVKKLRERLADGYLLNPVVAVALLKYRSFFVSGLVNRPGGYPFQEGLTVARALQLAGGMAGPGVGNRITLSRGEGPNRREREADGSDPVLEGDTIAVAARPRERREGRNTPENGLLTSYNLGPGDRIQIKVDDEPELTLETKISGQGNINFFFLGEIHVADRSAKVVETILRERLANGFLLNPEVYVDVLEYRMYYVHGEVKKAGGFPFLPGLTTRKAIVLAGGFTEFANEDRVSVIRGNDPKHREETIGLDEPVYPGDVITVMESFW